MQVTKPNIVKSKLACYFFKKKKRKDMSQIKGNKLLIRVYY